MAFRIFLGAPSRFEVLQRRTEPSDFRWQTVYSGSAPQSSYPLTLPPATLEAASRKISELYGNIIFQEDDDVNEAQSQLASQQVRGLDSTAFTWPPTAEDREQGEHSALSFLRPSGNITRSRLQADTQAEETQETGSYDLSDASSIGRFPAFHFGLHQLSSLSALSATHLHPSSRDDTSSRKMNLLLAVLEVDGPDTIRVKKGPYAGREVSILKLILGDEDGAICKLTAWREVADSWGGSLPELSSPRLKRGDVAFFENILKSFPPPGSDASSPLSLTASPNQQSRMLICYRTMPNSPEDARFRPDLRLGYSDSVVRKVAAVVAWFESVAGLHGS